VVNEIRAMEDAVAFLSAQIAAREQPAQPAPAQAIAWISEDVRRPVRKDEVRAGMVGERQLFFALDEMGAHHSGHRIAVAQPDAVESDMGRLQHQLLGMRGPAQEGEVRGNGELDISHAYTPCRNQRGAAGAISR